MATVIEGYTVRAPTEQELPALIPWFAPSSLGVSQCMTRAAFSRPGEVPLGAYIVRPSHEGHLGQFTLFVRPDCRRHGIGRFLIKHLYQLALANKCERLVLSEVIHQDHPDNAFYRSLGFSPDTKLGSYELDLEAQVLPVCQRIAERFVRTHPHLRNVRVTTLEQADPQRVAQFLTSHYGGFVDEQTRRLHAGYFDRELTTVGVRDDGSVTGVAFILSRPDEDVIVLDLVLTDPALRNGPTPLVLFDETARRAMAMGKKAAAFEGDERRDPFAIGFAARCGATAPKWYRYRYSIDRATMLAIP